MLVEMPRACSSGIPSLGKLRTDEKAKRFTKVHRRKNRENRIEHKESEIGKIIFIS